MPVTSCHGLNFNLCGDLPRGMVFDAAAEIGRHANVPSAKRAAWFALEKEGSGVVPDGERGYCCLPSAGPVRDLGNVD